jgi:hypothetical protein
MRVRGASVILPWSSEEAVRRLPVIHDERKHQISGDVYVDSYDNLRLHTIRLERNHSARETSLL